MSSSFPPHFPSPPPSSEAFSRGAIVKLSVAGAVVLIGGLAAVHFLSGSGSAPDRVATVPNGTESSAPSPSSDVAANPTANRSSDAPVLPVDDAAQPDPVDEDPEDEALGDRHDPPIDNATDEPPSNDAAQTGKASTKSSPSAALRAFRKAIQKQDYRREILLVVPDQREWYLNAEFQAITTQPQRTNPLRSQQGQSDFSPIAVKYKLDLASGAPGVQGLLKPGDQVVQAFQDVMTWNAKYSGAPRLTQRIWQLLDISNASEQRSRDTATVTLRVQGPDGTTHEAPLHFTELDGQWYFNPKASMNAAR